MEEVLADAFKWLFARSDPMLAGCIIILGTMLYRINRKIDVHMDPKTPSPHPDPPNLVRHLDSSVKYPHSEFEWAEKSYTALVEQLEIQRKENREDHQEIFNLLRGKK